MLTNPYLSWFLNPTTTVRAIRTGSIEWFTDSQRYAEQLSTLYTKLYAATPMWNNAHTLNSIGKTLNKPVGSASQRS
jgi:hypothetical protein